MCRLFVLVRGVHEERSGFPMPQTKAQRALFALLTVLITVHAYVFYSL